MCACDDVTRDQPESGVAWWVVIDGVGGADEWLSNSLSPTTCGSV